ncbi:hypothetical protein Hanom_Chr11g00993491 [Helianthus anomalus]
MGEAMIIIVESAYHLGDMLDLISFHEEDIQILNQNQICTNEQYEVFAKSWTSDVVNVIGSRLYVVATPLTGGSATGGPSS